ncbi:metal-dependent hydrolase [Vibrio campbellii]|uniref:metal-dependent hydrolase n=1 Tax=Vibrio campbellii TaxID=680 RepID=UPI00210867C3|nr:metal-dependent hydrolase [Vibrio campbellii]UTZ42949.1 metal-dependent hydrolase [Vibrio campbellii]
MDPLTQGLVGASLSLSASKKQHLVAAGALGLLAGMAPDLDILIRSANDPLLFLEFHRQFTHSLFFIPIGSFICALILHPLIARKGGLSLKQSWWYCALGYATHGLLDTCTSYGTQLLWPFTNTRYSWSTVSVIDPLFTLPIFFTLILALMKRNSWYPCIAVVWTLVYLTFGMYQRDRAEEAGWALAEERQHTPQRLEAKPTFANTLVWKVIYETEHHYHVDAIRAGRSIKTYTGESIAKLNVAADFPWLDPASQQAKDIERFRWFSDGFIASDSNNALRVIDVRYSIVPNEFNALWGIELSETADKGMHVEYTTHRDSSQQSRQAFIEMLKGD